MFLNSNRRGSLNVNISYNLLADMNNPESYPVLLDVIFMGERSLTLGDL